jgi:hypothetical protein
LTWNENLVSLEEDSLRDTTVFNSVLKDMESIVIEIIINSALADTVVFCGVLNNGLLEIGLKMEHLITRSLIFYYKLPICRA